jgi:hypothetical protein
MMSLWAFLLTALGAFVLLHFYAVPRARRAVPRSTGADILRRAAALALATSLRSIALVLSVVTMVLAIGVWLIPEVAGRSHTALLTAPLSALRGLREVLGGVEPWVAGISTAILMWMLVRSARRVATKRAHARLELIHQDQVNALLAKARAGTLEDLAPNAVMSELASEFNKVLVTREALEHAVADDRIAEAEAVGLRENLEARQEALQREYARIDILRRVELKLDEADMEESNASTSWWGKVRDIITSRGALTTLEGTAKVLRLALLVLLIPSLLATNARALNEGLEQRIARVDELRIAARAEDATADWEQALAALPEAPDDQAAVPDSVIDAVARSFEDAVFHTALIGRRIGPPVRSTIVRRQMLALATPRHLAPRDGGHVARVPETSIDDIVSQAERGPRTPLGQRYRDELRVDLERSPRLRARLRGYAASFSQPASGDDIARALLKQTLGYAAEGVRPTGDLLGTVYDGVTSTIDPGELRTSARRLMTEHKVHLTRASNLDEVTEWLTRADAQPRWTSRVTTGLNQVVTERLPDVIFEYEYRPPSLATTVAREADVARASNVLRDLVGNEGRASAARAERLTEALVEYDDYFPSGPGAERTTPRGRLLGELHPSQYTTIERSWLGIDPADGPVLDAARGASGGDVATTEMRARGGGAQRGRTPPASIRLRTPDGAGRTLASASRARSFVRLRGFSRIGGVLIGREPSDGRVDIRRLSYRIVRDRVEITLTDHRGQQVTLTPIRASVLHRALLYAADGRPTAVTMVTATPLAELKVLVHPALVDTPLGCVLIELDRFVDTYTGGRRNAVPNARERAVKIVYALHALYSMTWAQRVVSALTTSVIAEYDAESRRFLEQQRDVALRILRDPDTDSTVQFALALPDSVRSERYSPVFSHDGYYDRGIAATTSTCARENRTLAGYVPCVRRSRLLSARGSDLSRLLGALPTFEVWSGVREREFGVDAAFRDFQRHPQASPLQFMLQVAFTSDALDGSDEAEPFEFPAITTWIDESVRDALRRPAQALHQRILADAEEFVFAQRLARAALGGDLGPAFPMEQLVELTKATRGAGSREFVTPRWNPRPGELQYRLASDMAVVGGMLSGRARELAMECANGLVSVLALRGEASPLVFCSRLASEGFAAEMGATGEQAGALEYARSRVLETERAIELRKSLGVARYEGRQRACPAL